MSLAQHTPKHAALHVLQDPQPGQVLTVPAGFTRGAMVFKLTDPERHAEALELAGAHLFDPGGQGRPFRQWVVVPAEHADRWETFADHALTITPAG